jgi:hypothetical protein
MPKFRKKPITITAELYSESADIKGVCNKSIIGCVMGPHLHTLEGPLHISEGDWIITGVRGEQYPIKPDIFMETYEQVEE